MNECEVDALCLGLGVHLVEQGVEGAVVHVDDGGQGEGAVARAVRDAREERLVLLQRRRRQQFLHAAHQHDRGFFRALAAPAPALCAVLAASGVGVELGGVRAEGGAHGRGGHAAAGRGGAAVVAPVVGAGGGAGRHHLAVALALLRRRRDRVRRRVGGVAGGAAAVEALGAR